VRGVKIERILKFSNQKQKRGKKDHLSFADYMEMMKHDSYKRFKGGDIRRIR
jgi:hypothetical protein